MMSTEYTELDYQKDQLTSHAWDWAESEMMDLEKCYKSLIPDDNLRHIFLLGLAESFEYEKRHPIIEKELRKCGFQDIHLYYLKDDVKGIIKEFEKHIEYDGD